MKNAEFIGDFGAPGTAAAAPYRLLPRECGRNAIEDKYFPAAVFTAQNEDVTAPTKSRSWPFHLLPSVSREREAIERIGAREGWRAKPFGRGMQGQAPFFHVVEFWLENRLMIEVVSPAMARVYADFMQNAQLPAMSDPESRQLMHATHVARQHAA